MLKDWRAYRRVGWRRWRADLRKALRRHLPGEIGMAIAGALWQLQRELLAGSSWAESIRDSFLTAGAVLSLYVLCLAAWHLFGAPQRVWATNQEHLRRALGDVSARDATIERMGAERSSLLSAREALESEAASLGTEVLALRAHLPPAGRPVTGPGLHLIDQSWVWFDVRGGVLSARLVADYDLRGRRVEVECSGGEIFPDVSARSFPSLDGTPARRLNEAVSQQTAQSFVVDMSNLSDGETRTKRPVVRLDLGIGSYSHIEISRAEILPD